MILGACGFAQTFGTNGAGYFENMTPESESWVVEFALSGGDVLRVPGGAIVKFADPYTNRQGWGMTDHLVDSMYKTTEETEAESSAKWHNKVAAQPNRSFMDDLIALQIKKPDMVVIWVANMFIPPSKTVAAIKYMKDRGVKFVGVEAGNETYSQLDHNFADYIRKATAMRAALKAEFPDLWFSNIAAPVNQNRGDHIRWNDSLDTWMSDGDFVTIHYYVGEQDLPSMVGLLGKGYDAPTQELQTQFSNIRTEMINYQFTFQSGINKFDRAGGFIVTETNTKPSKSLGNTYLNAEWLFREMMVNGNLFDYFCLHNGVAPDVYGIIFGKPSEKNTSYDALKLAMEVKDQEWFVNDSGPYTIPGEAVWITAPFLSSSTLIFGRGNTIPANSFGYILKPACVELTFYADSDGDFYGDANSIAQGCTLPAGFVFNNTDCDDQDGTTYPGAFDACNNFDDNCNGLVDENWAQLELYADVDGDGFGSGIAYLFCAVIPGYTLINGDCNDEDSTVHPGAIEVCGNTTDEDCNGISAACAPPPPQTCMKKKTWYWLTKKCETTTDLSKCNCPK